ncbi:MAG TPA: hypothetical protein VF290_22135 [Pyrinomonadaceae bacterium]
MNLFVDTRSSAHREGRVIGVGIAYSLVVSALFYGGSLEIPDLAPDVQFPRDAELLSFDYDERSRIFYFLFAHWSLPPTSPGCLPMVVLAK